MSFNNYIKIGKNKYDNDRLFTLAENHHTWFHIANAPSAHLWFCESIDNFSKQDLYKIGLELKKNSKYSKINAIEIVYAQKSQLQQTNIPGQIVISGKSKILKV
jgi:predicted ribosome quality control (RQC) complex YloA/Tae2 family protein